VTGVQTCALPICTFLGRITGISSSGKLEIDTKTGTKQFDLKEVEFLN